MGIKIFLASFNKKVLMAYKKNHPNSEVNVLLSFGTRHNDYMDMMTTNKQFISGLILDSGAFSKNFSHSQEDITLPGFISYCKHFGKHFDYIFNYDEDFRMDGFETNLLNMRKIEKAGIKVVPVVHDYISAIVPEVEYYIKKKYPIISLGYSEHKRKNREANIQLAVSKITGAGLKVHSWDSLLRQYWENSLSITVIVPVGRRKECMAISFGGIHRNKEKIKRTEYDF